MGRLLDRLARRLWLPWLACIAMAVTMAVLPSRAEPWRFLVVISALAFMFIACAGYVRSYLRFTDELTTGQQASLRDSWPDWNMLPFVVASFLMLGAVEYFDLNRDLIFMPLLASVIVPSQLKARSELDAFTVSARAGF